MGASAADAPETGKCFAREFVPEVAALLFGLTVSLFGPAALPFTVLLWLVTVLLWLVTVLLWLVTVLFWPASFAGTVTFAAFACDWALV